MARGYFQHGGVTFPGLLYSPRGLEAAREFPVEDDDVFNVTYQKSGTVWMLEILSLIREGGDPSWCRSVPSWDRGPWLETLLGLRRARANARPRIISSHLPLHLFPRAFFTSKAKVIYTVRDPKDVLVSLFHFARMFRPYRDPGSLAQFLDRFLDGDVPFGSWFQHVRGWLQLRGRENFFWISYEELQQDLRGSVQRLCEFLGRPLSAAALDAVVANASFVTMSHNPMSNFSLSPTWILDRRRGPFLRKGISGDWRNHLSPEQSERFDRVYRQRMAGLGVSFPWDPPLEPPESGDTPKSPLESPLEPPESRDTPKSPLESPQSGDTPKSPLESPLEPPESGDTPKSLQECPPEPPESGDTPKSPLESPQTGDTPKSPLESPLEPPESGDTPKSLQECPPEPPESGDTPKFPLESPQSGDTPKSHLESPQSGDTPKSPLESPQTGDTPKSLLESPPEPPESGDTPKSHLECPQTGDTPKSHLESPLEPPESGDTLKSPLESPQTRDTPKSLLESLLEPPESGDTLKSPLESPQTGDPPKSLLESPPEPPQSGDPPKSSPEDGEPPEKGGTPQKNP